MDNGFLSSSSVTQGQSYSDSFSLQVLGQSPELYDRSMPLNVVDFGHQNPLVVGPVRAEQWHAWIEAEGKKRILTACFIIDNHAATFHESSRARADVDCSTIPLTGHSDALWSANSAEEWFDILQNDPATVHVQFLPLLDSLTPEQVAQYSVFDRSAILNAAALSMPRSNSQRTQGGKGDSQESVPAADDLRTPTAAAYAAQAPKSLKPDDQLSYLFSHVNAVTPNIYVALHHTPLHDLLAVSGDSWKFSQKVLGAPTFAEHKKRLKAWVEGRSSTSPTSPNSPTTAGLEAMSSAKAAMYSARALVGYFSRGVEASNGVTPYLTCVSDYWGMYVCALIIWAFGHKAGKPSWSGISGSPTFTKGQPMSEDGALAWLRVVAESDTPENIGHAKGRREASATIVSMVKRRLEADLVGGRSRLYIDAIGVLEHLEQGVDRRWF